MFRKMRREKQILSPDETEDILRRGSFGVLAAAGDGGYPYAVPLNYVYQGGKIYFHCAKSGQKLDEIRKNSRVSFCVVERSRVVPERLATDYRSVIAFGNASVLSGGDAIRKAMLLLIQKYASQYRERGEAALEKDWDKLCVVEISVDSMTGKKASGFS